MKIKVTYINTNTKDHYAELYNKSKAELINIIKLQDKNLEYFDKRK